jgi:hypothetical protein
MCYFYTKLEVSTIEYLNTHATHATMRQARKSALKHTEILDFKKHKVSRWICDTDATDGKHLHHPIF